MTSRALVLGAAFASLLGVGRSQADTPPEERRIAELEARVAELEERQRAASVDVVRAVEAVLRDAQQRSQLLAAGGDATAGYDNGFFIRSGDFLLRPAVTFQFRSVTNFRDDVAGDEDELTNGFEVRRLCFDLAGTLFTKDLSYYMQWETVRDTGQIQLLEMWARYMFDSDWGVRVGQIKDLFSHEFIISSKRRLAVDVSMVDSLIGGGQSSYTQGVTLIYGGYRKDNPVFVEAGVTDGQNEGNTGFRDVDFDYGLALRTDWKLTGNWASYIDFSAMNVKEDLWVVGGGADWSQNGDARRLLLTVDSQYKNAAGFAVYGALVGSSSNAEFTGFDDEWDWGGLLQVSFILARQWEPFARYDITLFDRDRVRLDGASDDLFQELTVGVAYYFGPDGSYLHRAKFTLDLSYLPEGAPPRNLTGLGIQADGDDEWLLRAQFQLII